METETATALIVDFETGEETIRPLTDEEIANREQMQTDFEAEQARLETTAKARTSALAKLKKLGLTDKEIAAL
jgi:hypothetical protein